MNILKKEDVVEEEVVAVKINKKGKHLIIHPPSGTSFHSKGR
jgi:hypothetical protein